LDTGGASRLPHPVVPGPLWARDEGTRSFWVHRGQKVFRCLDPPCGQQGNVLDLWALGPKRPLDQAARTLAEALRLQLGPPAAAPQARPAPATANPVPLLRPSRQPACAALASGGQRGNLLGLGALVQRLPLDEAARHLAEALHLEL